MAWTVAPNRRLSLTAANDLPDLPPRLVDADLQRLRRALYFVEKTDAPQIASNPMRLAVHAMNATLIVVALPIGAAMLTHSLIRGDSLRATTTALVATGIGFVMLQGPALQSLLSIAG